MSPAHPPVPTLKPDHQWLPSVEGIRFRGGHDSGVSREGISVTLPTGVDTVGSALLSEEVLEAQWSPGV